MDTEISLLSSFFKISKLITLILGKKLSNPDWISSFKKSKLSSTICSKIKFLNPAPKEGFKGLSPGLVRKKFIKLFLIASFVV